MAVDNKQIATDVLELVGGAENVSVATNCMTRLRLTLKDNSKADVEKIKKVKGVLGCQFAGSQLQVIIGQNVPKVLAEFVAISGVKQGEAVNENLDAPKEKFELKNLPNIILDYLSGSMTQLIPLLMAGGLFRTIAAVLGPTMLGVLSADDPTYTFLYTTLYEATFTFIPIYLGYAAAKKLGASPVLGMLLGGALMAPSVVSVATQEGGGIISEPIGGIHGNFAMLGVFEKGKADVRFTARSNGGHASAPPKNSPVARLAAFVDSMEKHPPFRKKFEPEVSAMFARLAAYAPFALRLLFGNLWLFAPLMKLVMPALSPQAGAMLRTTAAFTMLSGSDACNVLPQEASVWANLRFIPHQGMDESLALIKKRAEKYGIETEVLSASDYSAPADIHGEAWRRVTDTIAEVFPGLAWSPYVMTGATDAKNYQAICDNCIRFAPVIYGPEQMRGMHGVNENIETACLPGAVDFYKALIGKNR